MATGATDTDLTESGLSEFNVTESVTSSSSTLICTVPPPTPYERRNTFSIGLWEVSLFWANAFFAFVVVVGQTGRDLSLQKWVNSTAKPGSTDAYSSAQMYFVLSFASLSFVVIFGLGILCIRIFSPRDLGVVEWSYPRSLLFLVGLCNALHGVLTTALASDLERVPHHVQSIVGNFTIPLTILVRRLFLKKRPTLKKLLCAVVVTVTPIVYIIADNENQQSGWTVPLTCIMAVIDCLPAAMALVLEERGVKMQHEISRRGINLLYFLFWISTYQFVCVASALVWVFVLPPNGNTITTQDTSNIKNFGRNWWNGLHIFFGATEPAMIGTLFIFLYVCTYLGSANLLRHSEGATWLAIVLCLVTPLRCLFGLFFSDEDVDWKKDDAARATVALVLMFFASLIYNMGAPEISLKDERCGREEI